MGGGGRRPIAPEQPLDGLHRGDDVGLRGGGEGREQRGHFVVRTGVERGEQLAPRRREGQVAPAPVGRGARSRDETALLEAAQHAAQVARVEPQVAAQLGGRRLLAMRQLVQHAHLGQRERAVVRAAAQQADLPRVESVEAARRLHPSLQLARPHGGNVRSILDSVKYFTPSLNCVDCGHVHGRSPDRRDPTAQACHPPGAWQEARGLIYAHRGRLGLGLALLLVNRLAGLVLPASSKWVIDRVIGQHHPELLLPLALAAGGATLVQALTGFALSQVLGVAAQRAITDMRRTVQAYVLRLPVSYFDSTKSGILISRIMSDAEGIRNLVGTGLVQLVGGLVTGAIALGVLFYLNWRLTLIAILILACFGGGMAYAFTRLRPLFRERGKLNADVTGRLGETLGGIRIVKAYRAERGERLVFTRGAHTLFRNIATTMTGISGVGAFATLIVGAIGILMILEGGHAILSGTMTLGDFFMYGVFIGLVALPLINIASIGTQITEAFAGLDRIREIRRLTTEDAADGARPPLGEVVGDVRFEDVSFEYVTGKEVLRH